MDGVAPPPERDRAAAVQVANAGSGCAPAQRGSEAETISRRAAAGADHGAASALSLASADDRGQRRGHTPPFTALTRPFFPHRSRRARDQLQLLALIVCREAVAFVRRGEPALWADCEPLERNDRARLRRSGRAALPRFPSAASSSSRDQGRRHDPLAHGAADRKSLTLIVVLEQKAIEFRSRRRPAPRYGRTARRVEHALVIAAADVNSKGHAGMAVDDGIVELDAGVQHLVRIAAALPIPFADFLVEERRVRGASIWMYSQPGAEAPLSPVE